MLESLGRVGSLRRGILGLRETFGLSLALLALVMASSLGTSGAAGGAGAAVPLVYLTAGLGSLCLASVIIRFTSRMASAGGLYTYISRGLDRNTGFVGGWLYAWGFAAGISFVLIISSFFLSTVLTVHTSLHLSWFECFWILLALLTVFALGDIRISTRTQLVFAVAGVLLLVILACVILGKGGAAGVTLQPFNPSRAHNAHDFFYAMVFAFTGFIGFEAAAALGEESADPRRMIPKAILSAVLVALVFYVFLTWAMSIGFGVGNSGAWASSPAALDELSTRYVGSWFATLVDVAVVIDAFVAALAGTALVSRTAFAMGREGGLPKVFAWTHPRFNTPWVSIIASLGLTAVLVAWLARGTWNDAFTYFAFMATTATFGILATYILVSLAGMAYFWRTRGSSGVAYNIGLDVVLPVGAIAVCVATIYWNLVPWPSAPIKYAPWVALGWLGLGLVWLLWLRATAPEKVAEFGSVLAEGGDASEPPAADAAPAL
ncbi:MAG TPA: APC family permease [Gaiellaceae bacterium]|jgi:amino acid transporter|nr:APC family permease [Gaiellaceae bacterium]